MRRSKSSISQRASQLRVKTNYHYWTEEDKQKLYNAYLTHTRKYCYSLFPNRSKSSIVSLLDTFDICKRKPDSEWTTKEIKLLKENIEKTKNRKELSLLFPNHTSWEVTKKVRELGLKSNYNMSWTDEMDDLLREGKEVPYKSKESCKARCRELDINHPIYRPTHFWSAEEDNILKEYYPLEGREVYKRLPGRNRASCGTRASKLGLVVATHWWSPEDDAIIRENYPKYGRNNRGWMKKIVNHTESEILGRATTLGLKSEAKQDMTYCSKKVMCVETGKIYDSIAQAYRLTHISSSSIRTCLKGKKETAGGYHWRYVDEE